MKREFRRGGPGDQPTAGQLDELMADPPPNSVVGPLVGYRDGSRIRRWVYLGLVFGVVIAILVGRWYADHLDEQRKTTAPEYVLAAGTEDEVRADAMLWTSGVARLGLSRSTPGVRAIVLPDQIITLAPGCDHAQIKVDVRDGKTVALKVLVGEIRKTPRTSDDEPG